MKKRSSSLAMAAVLMAAVSVPGVANAGPKIEELQRQVPPDLRSADEIYAKLVELIGGNAATVRAVQADCGIGQTGSMPAGGRTVQCLRTVAEAIAQAREHAGGDLTALRGELDTANGALAGCRTDGEGCVAARDAVTAEAERLRAENAALAARLQLGGGTCDPDVRPVAAAEAYARAHCAPGSQICWHAPERFSCTDPLFEVVQGECALDASGTQMVCETETRSPAGRGGVTPLPLPPRIPEPPGTCSGVGGALLCYALPVAVVVMGGLLVADAASDDFNLVTVRR